MYSFFNFQDTEDFDSDLSTQDIVPLVIGIENIQYIPINRHTPGASRSTIRSIHRYSIGDEKLIIPSEIEITDKLDWRIPSI